VVQSVSYTTRPPRPEERDGREYHFITLQAFQQCCDHKAFLECAQVHEHWYGTSRRQIETATHAGLDVLLAIDVQGAMQLRTRGVGAVHIFVLPPSWAELEARLRARGSEAESTLARRLAVAQQELAHYTAYDYVIINNQFDQATAVLKAIIMAERHRVARVGTAPVTSLLETKEVQR
jgi:guanylate kinase